MKILEIDIHKPDFQTLKAAQELLADDYLILFPTDNGLSVLGKAGGASQKRFSAIVSSSEALRLAVSEDVDLDELAKSDIIPFFPDYQANRAFHTLVQLCDFPLCVLPTIADREDAAKKYPDIEYGFWPL